MAIFREPWALAIIIIVILLLFAAPKLPGMARALGQSMRIIKSEVKEMKNDGKTTPPSNAAGEEPVEGKIVNGVTTSAFPSVGLFVNDQVDPQDSTQVLELSCTATLIGCSTALTAAAYRVTSSLPMTPGMRTKPSRR